MAINVKLRRDGAKVELTNDGWAVFPGIGVSEYFNPQRYVSLAPPASELVLRPGALFKIYTGLGFSRLAFSGLFGLDVRARIEVYRKCGLRVERVDLEGLNEGELVIYVTVLGDYAFNKTSDLFESFTLGQAAPALEVLETPVVEGFVPPATKQITEAPRRSVKQTVSPEQSDEALRKKFEDFLNSEDDSKQSVEQSSVPGALAPATSFVGQGGKPAIVRPATPNQ